MCGKETIDSEEMSKYYNPIINSFNGPNMDLCPGCKEEYQKVKKDIFQKTSEMEKRFLEEKKRIIDDYMNKFRESKKTIN